MMAAALVALAVAAPAPAADLTRLDQALMKAGPEMVRFLQEGKYQAVGVLPLPARLGNGPLRADLGPLHRNLAQRLEVALVLNLPDDHITLIRNAGDAVAATKNRRLDHTRRSGREQFFTLEDRFFQSAWGDKKVRPDVFLTGEVTLAPNWSCMKVKVQAFDKDHVDKLLDVCEFTTSVDTRTLTEAGVSYAIPRGGEGLAQAPRYLPSPILPKDARADNSESNYNEVVEKCPIRLEVLVNGKPRKVVDGVLATPPTPDDTVTFRLANTGKERCAAVLSVNGRNTLFSETADPLHCYKWILKPGQSIEVEGFQKDDNAHDKFKVEPQETVKFNYGEQTGKISLVVFREADPGDVAVVRNEERRSGQDRAIARGSVRVGKDLKPTDFESLKSALVEEMKQGEEKARQAKSRGGVIVPGEEGRSQIEYIKDFSPYPTPVASVSLWYFTPKDIE
jgi:hypothetical protein